VLVIIAIAVVMAALFAATPGSGPGDAASHHRRARRPPRSAVALIGALRRATHGALTFRPYGSAAAAQHAIG
jgi:hypothetical protein